MFLASWVQIAEKRHEDVFKIYNIQGARSLPVHPPDLPTNLPGYILPPFLTGDDQEDEDDDAPAFLSTGRVEKEKEVTAQKAQNGEKKAEGDDKKVEVDKKTEGDDKKSEKKPEKNVEKAEDKSEKSSTAEVRPSWITLHRFSFHLMFDPRLGDVLA